MQWANWVKRRIRWELTAAEEMVMYDRDAEVMGGLDWWFKP